MKKAFLISMICGAVIAGVVAFAILGLRPHKQSTTPNAAETATSTPRSTVSPSPNPAKSETLRKQLKSTHQELQEKTAQLEQLQKKSESTNGFLALMGQPGMRDFIKAQQKGTLEKMLRDDYGDLPAYLNWPEDKTQQLMDSLRKRKEIEMDFGLDLMAAGTDAAKKGEAFDKFMAARQTAQTQIEQMLGDDGKKTMDFYEQTHPERKRVNEFRDALAATGSELPPQTANSLFEIMREERARTQFPVNFFDPSQIGADNFRGENFDAFFVAQAAWDQKVLQRASSLLTADQITRLREAQQKQLELQRTMLTMSRSLIAPTQ